MMQNRNLVGLLCHQMHSKDIRKKMVITIPVTLVIQRDKKEVASLQGIQPCIASALAGPFGMVPNHGITQRTIQTVEDGGLEQEASSMFRLALQHLFHQ